MIKKYKEKEKTDSSERIWNDFQLNNILYSTPIFLLFKFLNNLELSSSALSRYKQFVQQGIKLEMVVENIS